MADINLLQSQIKDTTLISTKRTKIVVWLCLVVLLGLIGSGIWLYLLTRNIHSDTSDLTDTNNQLQVQLDTQQQGLDSAKAYQAQLGNLKSLLKEHIAVSPLMEELAKYTYQKAVYSTFDVGQNTGKVHVEGMADSYTGLGKLLLGLSTSSHFTNVKLLSVNQGTGEVSGFTFSIDMKVKPDLFITPQ